MKEIREIISELEIKTEDYTFIIRKNRETENKRNTIKYLKRNLCTDKATDKLNEQLKEYIVTTQSINPIEEFPTVINNLKETPDEWRKQNTYEAYNGGLLDRYLEYSLFTYKKENYIILSIHGGGDARTNYSTPRIFKIKDESSFFQGIGEIIIECKKCHKKISYINKTVYDVEWLERNGEKFTEDEIDFENMKHTKCNGLIILK